MKTILTVALASVILLGGFQLVMAQSTQGGPITFTRQYRGSDARTEQEVPAVKGLDVTAIFEKSKNECTVINQVLHDTKNIELYVLLLSEAFYVKHCNKYVSFLGNCAKEKFDAVLGTKDIELKNYEADQCLVN